MKKLTKSEYFTSTGWRWVSYAFNLLIALGILQWADIISPFGTPKEGMVVALVGTILRVALQLGFNLAWKRYSKPD